MLCVPWKIGASGRNAAFRSSHSSDGKHSGVEMMRPAQKAQLYPRWGWVWRKHLQNCELVLMARQSPRSLAPHAGVYREHVVARVACEFGASCLPATRTRTKSRHAGQAWMQMSTAAAAALAAQQAVGAVAEEDGVVFRQRFVWNRRLDAFGSSKTRVITRPSPVLGCRRVQQPPHTTAAQTRATSQTVDRRCTRPSCI